MESQAGIMAWFFPGQALRGHEAQSPKTGLSYMGTPVHPEQFPPLCPGQPDGPAGRAPVNREEAVQMPLLRPRVPASRSQPLTDRPQFLGRRKHT